MFASIRLNILLSILLLIGQPAFSQTKDQIEAYTNYAKGARLCREGKLAEAEPLMRSVLDIRPESGMMQQGYAALLLRLGKPEEAVKILNHITELEPTYSMAWGHLGSAYAAMGKLEEAIAAYKKYVELIKNQWGAKAVDSDLAPYRSIIALLEDQLKREKENPESSKDDYFKDAIAVKGRLNWPLSKNPIRVYIEPGTGKKGFKPEFIDVLKKAFDTWSQVSDKRISFQFVESAPGAQIYCKWTDSKDHLLALAEGGHSRVVYVGPLIGYAEITLLSNPAFVLGDMSEKLAYKFALHEIGHALGIMGHSRNSADVMYCGMSLAEVDTTLSLRDRKTYFLLYEDQLIPRAVNKALAVRLEKLYKECLVEAEKSHSHGDPDAASKLYFKAAAYCSPYGFYDQRLAKALVHSAEMLFEEKKYTEAEIIFRAALNILDNNDKAESIDKCHCCTDLGDIYFSNKNYPESKYYYEKALQHLKLNHSSTCDVEAKLKKIPEESGQ